MLKYIILGITQGLTEFLPVSSSAHLVILQKFLGISGNELAVTVVLHLGTTCALILFFFKDILKTLRDIKLLLLIAVVTIVTVMVAFAGRDFFEYLFTVPRLIGITLIFTGIILIYSRKFMQAKRDILGIRDALVLGLAQALAIIPGISRSGITISTLLFRGINPVLSFRFSFLAAIPAVLGATLLEAKKIDMALKGEPLNLTAGFIASLLTGLFALGILKWVLIKARWHYFGYYCIFVAIITLLFIK